jgi:hypothetical protein
MSTYRFVPFSVILLITLLTKVAFGTETNAVSLEPDRVLKGTSAVITVNAANIEKEDALSARIGSVLIPVEKNGDKRLIPLPKMDFVGQADVELLKSDGKTSIGTGKLNFVEPDLSRDFLISNWMWVIFIYVFLVGVPPVVFILYDIRKSYKERSEVITKIKDQSINASEVKELLKTMEDGPTGFTGLTRGIIAVTLIFVVAIAIFHILVFRADIPKYGQDILLIVANTITAIVGFYFGSRAASSSPTQPVQGKQGKQGQQGQQDQQGQQAQERAVD